MTKLILAGALLLMSAWSAPAQTTGANPLTIIAEYESTYGTNTNNGVPGNTASGIFQDLSATWAQALQLCGCGTVAEYPSAGSAPASVQLAANAALYNADGFEPWICSGCDPALAAAIQAAGGASAFQAPGTVSTDPTTYAAADTSLADYFAANGAGGLTVTGVDETGQPTGAQLSGITVTADPATTGATTIGQAASAAGVTGSSGSTMNPFEYLYSAAQTGVIQPLQADLQVVQSTIAPWVTAILSLSVMIMAVAGFWGGMPMDALFYRVLRIAIVVPLVAVGSSYYSEYIVGMANALPLDLGNALTNSNYSNPAAPFDVVLHHFNSGTANVAWDFPWGVVSALYGAFMGTLAWLILVVFLFLLFTPWIASQILLQLILVLGPIFVLGWLFENFHGVANRWISALLMFAATSVATQLLASLYLAIINTYLGSVNMGSSGTQNNLNLVSVVVIIGTLGTATAIIPRLFGFILSADGVAGMAGIERFNAAVSRIAQAVATRGAAAGAALFLK